jgi:hypothetical protein
MKTPKLLPQGLINALSTFIYTGAVAWLMFNGEQFFGKATSFVMPLALLLLFVVSAAVTGLLMVGKPILLYLDGAKKEAVKLLFYTLSWLALMMIVVFIVILVIK